MCTAAASSSQHQTVRLTKQPLVQKPGRLHRQLPSAAAALFGRDRADHPAAVLLGCGLDFTDLLQLDNHAFHDAAPFLDMRAFLAPGRSPTPGLCLYVLGRFWPASL